MGQILQVNYEVNLLWIPHQSESARVNGTESFIILTHNKVKVCNSDLCRRSTMKHLSLVGLLVKRKMLQSLINGLKLIISSNIEFKTTGALSPVIVHTTVTT
jgi:hypothetical protein